MEITALIEYPGSVEAVVSMLSDPKYCALKCQKTGATEYKSAVTGDPAGEVTITTTRNVPAEMMPSKIRRFVGSNLQVRDVVTLHAPDASGNRTGDMVVTVIGVPCSLNATATLKVASPVSSVLDMRGNLVAKIPLIGSQLEKAAAPAIKKILGMEERLAKQFLAGEI